MDIGLRQQYDRYETDYLVEMSTRELTDEAREALQDVLRERGVAADRLTAARETVIGDLKKEERLASLPARALAYVIDWWGGAIAAGIVALPASIISERAYSAVAIWIWLAYILSKDWLPGGGSLGKRMLGIRVISTKTGGVCTWVQSALRNGALIVPFEWVLIFGKQRRRFGDIAAETEVVRRQHHHAPQA